MELLHKCEASGNFISKAFCEGGFAMYFIAACGFLVIFLIIERFFSLKNLSLDKDNVSENLFGLLLQGNVRQAIAFCDGSPAPLTNNFKGRSGAGDE